MGRGSTPQRVFVDFGKRPPRGVLWGEAAVGFHATRRHYSRFLGAEVGPEPARLDELREIIRTYLTGRHTGDNWGYYRGRNLACPYRCPLDSPNCPVDVLVEEINRPSAWWARVQGHTKE